METNSSIFHDKVCAVIVAAGRGTRMNMAQSKQYVDILDKPVVARTIQAFQDCGAVDGIIVVVNEQDMEYCRQEIIDKYCYSKVTALVAGGAERQDSVFSGLRFLPSDCGIVLIHDGARPFIDNDGINSCIAAATEFGSACMAVPVKDTIKCSDTDGFIEGTPERSRLWQAQTPQAFRYGLIMEAYQKAEKEGFRGTDDTVLAERLGIRTRLVPGSYFNIKITTREDLVIAEAIAKALTGGQTQA
ncbi:MAG: 2-C-methyl-D-erythritol 4-phosphate cytidylyltransferase [Clostridiales bacterium]|nr:2-C-methyl-D-erythritol 4-phosphate cytidylyltransferase [Clostridiales bacterium]